MKRIIITILILSILVHISFLLSLKQGFWNPFFNDTAPYMKGQGGDFFVFYSSAQYMLEGKSIYSFYEHPSVPYSYAPYVYLPHLILIIGIPITLFSPWVSYWLWVALSEGLLLLCAYLTYRMAKKWNHPYPWLGAVPWLVFTPVYLDLYLGHVEIILAFFFMLLLWGQSQGKKFLAYLGWTGGLFIKFFTLPFAFAFLRQKMARWVLLTLALTLLPFLIYLAFFDPEHLLNIYQIRFRSFARAYAGAPNFLVLLDLWGATPGILFLVKFFIVGLGVMLSLAKEVEPADNWSLWMASFLLVYGFLWEHHYLMLLPFLVFYLIRQKDPWLWGVYLLLALPTPYIFYREKKIYDSIYYLSKALPLLAFYAYILGRHLRAPTRWLYFDRALQKVGASIKK